jgi:NTE family protein
MTKPPEKIEGPRQVEKEGDRRPSLHSLELFDALHDEALAALEHEARWIELPAGAEVFREGEASDSLYLVAHGRLAILQREPAGGERVVREVAAGQPIGELGLLLDRPRSATAKATRDSLLVRLDRAGFERLIAHHPSGLLALTRRIAERLVTRPPAPSAAPPSTTLIVAASPDVPLQRLWRELTPRLAAHGARCLTAEEVARRCDDPRGLEPARAARWLEAETRAGGRIFVLGAEASAIQRLTPSVDRMLLVADAGGEVGAGPLEEHLAQLRAHGVPVSLDLALLQSGGRLPRDTAAWLERVQPRSHHHLRLGEGRDLDRLARRLAGRAVGLALGGGGARAFAHIGALRALREAAVPIDLVAGTSIGAVIGAQLALGWEPERMLADNQREWRWVGRDRAFPFVSLLGARRLSALMERMFGDVAIEDLWLDFSCATVDLSWCQLVSQRTGPLRRWVLASASVPGIHPPVVHGGRLWVDGGLLSSVPAAVVRDAGAATLISVDPSPFRRQTIDERLERPPSGLGFLLDRVPLIGSGFPSLLSLIYRAMSAAQHAQLDERKTISDLYVEPPVDRFGITDYDRVAEIAALGYEETRRRLERDGLPVPA